MPKSNEPTEARKHDSRLVGIEAQCAPTVPGFLASLTSQQAVPFLDIVRGRMYIVVVKQIHEMRSAGWRFRGALRMSCGAGIGWDAENEHAWIFYDELDRIAAFEGTYYPQTGMAHFHVDPDHWDNLANIATGEEAVIIKLERQGTDTGELFVEETPPGIADVMSLFIETMKEVESQRVEQWLKHYGLSLPAK